jgi:hypothetical protein
MDENLSPASGETQQQRTSMDRLRAILRRRRTPIVWLWFIFFFIAFFLAPDDSPGRIFCAMGYSWAPSLFFWTVFAVLTESGKKRNRLMAAFIGVLLLIVGSAAYNLYAYRILYFGPMQKTWFADYYGESYDVFVDAYGDAAGELLLAARPGDILCFRGTKTAIWCDVEFSGPQNRMIRFCGWNGYLDAEIVGKIAGGGIPATPSYYREGTFGELLLYRLDRKVEGIWKTVFIRFAV